MNTYVFFLGSHPDISASEVWLTLRSQEYTPRLVKGNHRFLIVETPKEITTDFLNTLGGVDRVALLLATQPHTPTEDELLALLSPLAPKFTIGISGVNITPPGMKYLVNMKKKVKQDGGRLKFIIPKGGFQLNSAQVLFNSLYKEPNSEISFVRDEETIYITRTIWAQDIEAYELRDTLRPVRKGKVGMLPPKLAQMMLNIAISHSTTERPLTIFDPFCGGGTVLQEGWLMGHTMKGSDSDANMIDAAKKNLTYLAEKFPVTKEDFPELIIHDIKQPFFSKMDKTMDTIVTEPFLGRPLSTALPEKELHEHMNNLGALYRKTFANILPVLKKDGIILFLIPAFRQTNDKKSDFWLYPLSFLDGIKELGYRQEQLIPSELEPYFSSTDRKTLLYSRPDAYVGRELTLWKKI